MTARFEKADCVYDPPTGRNVTCGYLTVPEHRNGTDGDQLRLHVAIIEAQSEQKAADPIVYLAGGPGENALATLPFVFDLLAPLAADRDLIVFDQRGTGASEPNLACPELTALMYEILDVDVPDEELLRLERRAFEDCRNRLEREGVDVTAYTSAESAADVRDLRLALGYEEWNVLGISYGTRLAQTVMRDHPEGIRSVILDSSYPLEVNLYEALPGNLDRALSTITDACRKDQACAEAYPDLADDILVAYRRLEERPVRTQIVHPLTQQSFDALIDGDALIGQIFQGLYSPDIIPSIPELVADALEGDVELVSLLAGISLLNAEFVSTGMQLSVQCAEEVAFTTEEDLQAAVDEHPRIQPFVQGTGQFGASLIDVCEMWEPATVSSIEDEPVVSDLPTLVLAGHFDPVTPPAWGQTIAERNLTNATFVEFPDQAHGAIGSECARDIVLAFLADPNGKLDTQCDEEPAEMAFVLPLGATEMVPFQLDPAGLTGLRPERWSEMGPGTFGRSPLGDTVLIQQAVPGAQPDEYLRTFLAQLGISETPEPSGERTANGLNWTLYEVEVQSSAVDIALTETEDTTLVVISVGLRGKRDALREHVFFPAVDALAPRESP